MSPRRHADDDADSPGLADALARWDTAQDWMRSQGVPADPGGWPPAAAAPAGGPGPVRGDPGAPTPPPPPAASFASPNGAVGMGDRPADQPPQAAPPQAAPPPPPSAPPAPVRPPEAAEPALPWAPPAAPQRWGAPGTDHARSTPPVAPAPAGWRLPPPPAAPATWEALLEPPSHPVEETRQMPTSATGGEAERPPAPQAATPGGGQTPVDPAGPDARGHAAPPPAAPGPASGSTPEPVGALPWESAAEQQPHADAPPAAGPRQPDTPAHLGPPPQDQAPPWDSAGWGGSPEASGSARDGAQNTAGEPPAGSGTPPGGPAPTTPGALQAGPPPGHAGQPEAGQQPAPPPGTTAPSPPTGPPSGESSAVVAGPGGPPPPAPLTAPPAGPTAAPPPGWPAQAPPGWQRGPARAGVGGGELPYAPEQARHPSGPIPRQSPQPPPPTPVQQTWAGQPTAGPWPGYGPRWAGAQPPADVPVWAPPGERGAPTVEDLTAQSLIRRRKRAPQSGWRKALYTLSAHAVNPGEAPSDVRRRELMERATVPVRGCYRIAVISLKGGVGKTTMTVCLGATLASLRGDRVIAVDANPDRGTLSGKLPLETVATVRNLLNDADRISRYSDVRRYTSQSPDRLEVLASESDPAVSIAFSEQDYRVVAGILERFYNVVLTDCGTGLLHSAMAGVLALANQLVVVSSGSVDGARSASATLDWLEAHGFRALVAGSVAVINSVRPKSGGVDLDRLQEHFAARCRAVVRVPYDPHLEEGAEVDLSALRAETRFALLELAAHTADGFPREPDPHRRMLDQPRQPQLP